MPRQLPELAAARDVAAAQPAVAAAVLEGLMGDRPPGDDLDRLATFTAPTLVIGHRRDPLHVLDDARDLVDRLPNARLVVASSIAEFRLHPDRLAAELVAFLDRVEW